MTSTKAMIFVAFLFGAVVYGLLELMVNVAKW